ncbi:MAG: 1,2-phenylacetyl-CoA epoxidase subunit PaaD [Pseudomonadota bacterium]
MSASELLLWCLLEEVKDPEIPVLSLRDLGVLRDIQVQGDNVEVVITPTYSGCPAMQTMEDDIRARLTEAGYAEVTVRTQLSPAWTTDWINEDACERLRREGIAPPLPDVKCPRCGSAQTRVLSEFASTSCQALYQCQHCAEPFNYFKVL